MLKTQDYLDLVERHRKEIEVFPIAYVFDDKLFKEEINRKKKGKTHSKNGKTIELYYGTLPVNKTVEKQPVAEKIIYDRIAKWKAEQMGL